jgi:putative nucleotidyltransferase with HDIG domain
MLEPLLEQAGELPSLPEVYIRVTELLESENATAEQIGVTLQSDPALTARILRLINSAYYGLRNDVSSIPQAVSLLGRDQLQQVLLGSVLSAVFKDFDVSDFPLRDFWQHCIKTAIIARQLAMQNARIIDHEAFFTVGLLHDIGWLVIAKVSPGSYLQIINIARAENRNVLEVEIENLGTTHIEVGAALLQQWGIPEMITQCIKNHHDIEHGGSLAVETSIAYLANQLSRLSFEDNVTEEDEAQVILDILATIPNWEASKCTGEQIAIACRLADQQWLEVMESLGMRDLEIDDNPEETFLFNTSLEE